jgi:two-component system response regulator AgrA
MLEVFICEDNDEQRSQLTRYISDYIMIENLDMKITLSTAHSKEIIDYVQNHNVVGLYFMDVDLKEDKNGIVTAAEIREHDPQGSIVFVTTHSELTYLTFTYKVEAMDYISKDQYTDMKKRVLECVNTAYNRYMKNNYNNRKLFQVKSGEKMISVDYNDILFFETALQPHKLILHTVNRQVEFYYKLKDVLSMDSRFYRCHNSFVVNKDNIAEIDTARREIIMINGQKCFASNRYLKGLKGVAIK